jgi:hypothetical protein
MTEDAMSLDDLIDRIMSFFPKEYDEIERSDARNVLCACLVAISDEEMGLIIAKEHFSQIKSEPMGWIDALRGALIDAEDTLTEEQLGLFTMLWGAFLIAQIYVEQSRAGRQSASLSGA